MTEQVSQEQVKADLTSFLSGGASEQEQAEPVVEEAVEQEGESSTQADVISAITEGEEEEEPTADEEEDEVDTGEEDDSEEESDEDEPQRNSLSDDDEFEIEVGGEQITVKGSELKSGYMRHKDYTKKTQELSEERKAITEKQTDVVNKAEMVKFQAHTKLEQFDKAVEQMGGWENLRKTNDPAQVEQFTKMYVDAQKEAQTADTLINDYSKQVREQNIEQIKSIFEGMSNTFSGFGPEATQELDSYITDNGFTPEMVMSVTHPQAWEMMYKAMLYDKAQSRSKVDKAESNKQSSNKASAKSVPGKKGGASKGRKLDKALEAQRKAKSRPEADAAGRDAMMAFLESQK